jgi:hypothetical protein
VRLHALGVGVDEGLEDLVAVELVNAPAESLVAPAQEVPDLVVRLLGQPQAQPVILDPLAPDLIELGLGLRPLRVLPVELVALLLAEVELPVEDGEGIGHAFVHPLAVDAKELEGGFEPAALDVVVESVRTSRVKRSTSECSRKKRLGSRALR